MSSCLEGPGYLSCNLTWNFFLCIDNTFKLTTEQNITTTQEHEPVPVANIVLGLTIPGKSWVTKQSWWCSGIMQSDKSCQFIEINEISAEIHLQHSTESSTSNATTTIRFFIARTMMQLDHRMLSTTLSREISRSGYGGRHVLLILRYTKLSW